MLNKESKFFADIKARQEQIEQAYNNLHDETSNSNNTNAINLQNDNYLDKTNLESEITRYEENSNKKDNNLETTITINFEDANQINSSNTHPNKGENLINVNSKNFHNSQENNYNYSNLKDQDFPNPIRKYGNLFTFLNYNNAPIFVIGPNWPFFLALTLVLFLSFFLVFIVLANKLHFIIRIIGIVIYFLQFLSYTACSILNPGLADNRYLENSNFIFDKRNFRPCTECRLLINMNTTEITYHCFECEICVEGYDHHCPWTTKCIGKKNLWLFYAFILFTFAYVMNLFIAISSLQ